MFHPVTWRFTDLGGTPEGNAASSLDAIPKVLDFLETGLRLLNRLRLPPGKPSAISVY